MMRPTHLLVRFCAPLLMLSLTLGCEAQLPDEVSPAGTIVQSRLTAVHFLHSAFRQKRKRSPGDAAELQSFGLELPTHEGGPVSLTDDFLFSPRDQRPIVVRYGLDVKTGDPLLAHEANGFEGRRFVVYASSGKVEELDDATFQGLLDQP